MSNANELGIALRIAAEEAFKEEIIDTEMYDHIIGENGDYSSAEDWVADRIAGWIEKARRMIDGREVDD